MDRKRARTLRNFLADERDRLGLTDDVYAARLLEEDDLTVGDMIDLLDVYLEPIET